VSGTMCYLCLRPLIEPTIYRRTIVVERLVAGQEVKVQVKFGPTTSNACLALVYVAFAISKATTLCVPTYTKPKHDPTLLLGAMRNRGTDHASCPTGNASSLPHPDSPHSH